MVFSHLQQHILKECYIRKDTEVDRQIFSGFYDKKSQIKQGLKTKITTKSMERLIDRGMLVGYGVRTPKKWFIKKVKLTVFGRKQWQRWLKRKQKKLPL
ncbi:MAG: hypothetical protein ABIH87_03135 [bacterium]